VSASGADSSAQQAPTHARAATVVLQALGVLLVLAPFLPPVLRKLGLTGVAEAFDAPWTFTCHRLPDRTMDLLGTKMAMCSRCTGIVSGLGLGLVIGRPYRGPTVLWACVAVASALLVLEMLTQNWGWHPVWHSTRLLTGFLLAYPVAAAVAALVRRGPPVKPRETVPARRHPT
jgi:uncharacterized membrane protein